MLSLNGLFIHSAILGFLSTEIGLLFRHPSRYDEILSNFQCIAWLTMTTMSIYNSFDEVQSSVLGSTDCLGKIFGSINLLGGIEWAAE